VRQTWNDETVMVIAGIVGRTLAFTRFSRIATCVEFNIFDCSCDGVTKSELANMTPENGRV
jgi:hypothetical protein